MYIAVVRTLRDHLFSMQRAYNFRKTKYVRNWCVDGSTQPSLCASLRKEAQGVIKLDLNGGVTRKEHCVECSKTDASCMCAARFIFTATLKNEWAG
jgi:hypothetical protein